VNSSGNGTPKILVLTTQLTLTLNSSNEDGGMDLTRKLEEPEKENKFAKKKMFEQIAPNLTTNEYGVVCFLGKVSERSGVVEDEKYLRAITKPTLSLDAAALVLSGGGDVAFGERKRELG